MMRRWRDAMEWALYGPGGFYRRPGVPAAHFRTSAHTGPVFARAVARLVTAVDEALGRPDTFDLVDVGAGGGELLLGVLGALEDQMLSRVRPVAVELASRPEGLPAPVGWRDDIPDGVTGVLLATEWLDNVPLDVAVFDGLGWRYLLVDVDGTESVGPAISEEDSAWLARWWPGRWGGDGAGAAAASDHVAADAAGDHAASKTSGSVGGWPDIEGWPRAEIGRTRDGAWAAATSAVAAGVAVAVDYGHVRGSRPVAGTLVGFRDGREVGAVPDGSCDLTAHVAVDAVAAAGGAVAGSPAVVMTQREALRRLGVDGRRPPLELARTDPAGYVRALAAASHAAELTEQGGLGEHYWLIQPVRVVGEFPS